MRDYNRFNHSLSERAGERACARARVPLRASSSQRVMARPALPAMPYPLLRARMRACVCACVRMSRQACCASERAFVRVCERAFCVHAKQACMRLCMRAREHVSMASVRVRVRVHARARGCECEWMRVPLTRSTNSRRLRLMSG